MGKRTKGETVDDVTMARVDALPTTDSAIVGDDLIKVRPGYRKNEDRAGLPALLDAIRHMHGCEATWLESVPVREVFQGEVAWEGSVQVFALVGHAKASRCFAWSHQVGEGPRRRFYAVLGAGPVVDAVSAVRVAIAAG